MSESQLPSLSTGSKVRVTMMEDYFVRASTPKKRSELDVNTGRLVSILVPRSLTHAIFDVHVYDQFQYFRREFIEICASSQITIPLDIMEDTSGRFFMFIQHKVSYHPSFLL